MKKAMSLAISLVFITSWTAVYAQDESAGESAPMAGTEQSADSQPVSEPSQGTVARSIFTSNIQDHEPVDQLTSATTDLHTVSFFTELKGFEGQTVTHRWEYNGENMAEVKFQVGGPRWRVWSSKNMLPEWVGSWKVSVVNGNGDVVASETLNYTASTETSAQADDTTTVANNAAAEADAEPTGAVQ
jgi:hypothetical protein